MRTMQRHPSATTQVWHVGVVGELPGGIAQILRQYEAWTFRNCSIKLLKTTSGPRDPRSPIYTALAILRILNTAFRRDKVAFVVHLSQRGSFIREGLIVILCRGLRLPVVAHLHGSEFIQFATKHPLLVRVVLSKADRVLVLTDESASVVRELTENYSNVYIVPNAVVNNDYILEPKRTQIVFAGEVSHRKGADLLNLCWPALKAKYPEWDLILFGPRTSDAKIDSHRLEYRGAVPNNEVQRALGSAAIAVLPSRNEALPMFLLEGMAAKCAIIGTEVGQVTEMLAEGAGIVVEPGSAKELAQAIERLIEDDQVRQEIAERGFDRFKKKYSESVVAECLEELWLTK